MAEFSQAIYPETSNIIKILKPSDAEGIIPLFGNYPGTFENFYRSAGNHVNIVRYVRDLRARISIKSLAASNIPEIDDLSTTSERITLMRNYEWGQSRFHLELLIKQESDPSWETIGEISLMNKIETPFYMADLGDFFSAGTIELGEQTIIGCRIKNVGYGHLAGEDKVTIFGTIIKEIRVISLFADMNILGKIEAIPYANADPGYVLCDGRALNRNIYFQLFQKISTTFGAGDGSTTFNVPNLQNRVIIGTVPRAVGNTANAQSFALSSGGSTFNSIALSFQIYTGVFI